MEKTRTYQYDTRPFNPEVMSGFSGLEYLRQVFDGTLPGPSIAQTLDIAPNELEEGRVVFRSVPADYVLNPIGSVHGGYAATLLDTALGCAVHSALRRGMGYTTVELKVNYVRPMTARTGPVLTEGKIIHLGKTIATAEARLFGETDGKLYAHGSTTCLLFPLAGRGEA